MESVCPNCGRLKSPEFVMTDSRASSSGGLFLVCRVCTTFRVESPNLETQDFIIFVDWLAFAYREFLFNRIVHKKVETELYNKFASQWDTILMATELDCKLWLWKLLETKFLKNYSFEGKEKYDDWRNEFGAHLQLDSLRDWKKFREKNDLSFEEIEVLFQKVIEIADERNRKQFRVLLDLKEKFRLIEQKAIEDCEVWLVGF